MSELISLEDQARLNRTQHVRESIIAAMMPNNQVPEDRNQLEVLLKAASDMDRQVLSKAKLKSDDQNSKAQAAMADTVTTLLLQMGRSRKTESIEREEDVVLELDDPQDVVPGETFIGVKTFQYDEIVKPT